MSISDGNQYTSEGGYERQKERENCGKNNFCIINIILNIKAEGFAFNLRMLAFLSVIQYKKCLANWVEHSQMLNHEHLRAKAKCMEKNRKDPCKKKSFFGPAKAKGQNY